MAIVCHPAPPSRHLCGTQAMENEWGRKLYSKTLIRNIGQACYKDREQIEKGLKAQYPNLRGVPSSNFEYAMK
eukprot:80263-Chlamydomonas_euryale.AAC.8